MRSFLVFVLLLGLGAGATWFFAGRADGPAIEIAEPSAIGQTGQVVVIVDAPGGTLTRLDVSLEQNGAVTPVFALAGTEPGELIRDSENRLRVTREIGKQQVPSLVAGPARITVTAVRPVLFGLREVQSEAVREIEVRLLPPRVAVQSSHHYINHGGSEMVVYRASSESVASGVRVGDHEYRGFPAAGAGISGAGPDLYVAFFALLWDQPLDTPIRVFARDELGNEAHATLDYRVFPKNFRKSRIELDDRFLARVVPAILQNTPELTVPNPGDLLDSYLRINRDLRRDNNARLVAIARESAPQMLWQGPFKQLVNSAVEAGFADQRAYIYKGQEVDHQVHLGFDLASTSAAPVQAANHGTVSFAGWFGIYGYCVVLDHGMGLQSLYAHLSSIDVRAGDTVKLGQMLGRSGATGLAGGDHLHFTMLLAGNAVTPIDWWSPKWVQDRVIRKLREAGPVGE